MSTHETTAERIVRETAEKVVAGYPDWMPVDAADAVAEVVKQLGGWPVNEGPARKAVGAILANKAAS